MVIGVCAALVGLLTYGLASTGSNGSLDQQLADGKRPAAPQRKLAKLGSPGQTASLADYRGKVVVLNVWASWCKPCVTELPLLDRTHRRLRRDDALVLGVNREDITEKALGTVRKLGVSFASVRDPDGEFTGQELFVSQVPETFVIDRQGRIAAHSVGQVSQQWLDTTLLPLLAENA